CSSWSVLLPLLREAFINGLTPKVDSISPTRPPMRLKRSMTHFPLPRPLVRKPSRRLQPLPRPYRKLVHPVQTQRQYLQQRVTPQGGPQLMSQACPLRDRRRCPLRRPRLVSGHRPRLATRKKVTPHKSERQFG